jgi:CubicO group peptidase (beta-lactamase class C family)
MKTKSKKHSMNKSKFIGFFFAFLMLSINFISAQDFAKIAEDIMAKDSIPEMAYAIVTKDSILIKNVLGHHIITEVNEKPNANITDYFHLGSNTKAITGFIAANLVEQDIIKWDTKFFDLFPELKNKSNPAYNNITLEDLLSHRANIQPYTTDEEFESIQEFTGNKQQKRTKFAEYILTLPSVENEKPWNYSNAGYGLASVMLEKVSEKSWEELCTEILKEKLEIDFVFGWPNRNYENQPFGHWSENGQLIPFSPQTDYDVCKLMEPAGDISMNIENYIKFIQLNLKGLSGENNILKSDTYKYLHTAKDEYAIGWVNMGQTSQHAGSDGTFYVVTLIDRENLIGYITFVNNGAESAVEGVRKMIIEMIKSIEK